MEGGTHSCQDREVLPGGLPPTVAEIVRVVHRIKVRKYEGKEFLDPEAMMHLTLGRNRRPVGGLYTDWGAWEENACHGDLDALNPKKA